MPLHDTTITGPASLRIQSVLYNNSQQHIDTALESIGRAADLAIASDALSSVEIALGDCSPEPVFTSEEIETRAAKLRPQGVTRIQYRSSTRISGQPPDRIACLPICRPISC